MKIKDLEDLEVVTAITLIYKNDIETRLLMDKEEVLQEDFAYLVYEIYVAYKDLKVKASLLDLINNKHIEIL